MKLTPLRRPFPSGESNVKAALPVLLVEFRVIVKEEAGLTKQATESEEPG